MTQTLATTWRETLVQLRTSLPQLVAVHLIYMILGLILFAPLAGVTGRILLNLSGKSVLSDLDIIYFFLTPAGLFALIIFASLLITILVFEQASLMAVCATSEQGQPPAVISVMIYTVRQVKTFSLFAMLLVLRMLFITLPFLSLAGAIASVLLNDYDINYYLMVKPPIFMIAEGGVVLVSAAMLFVKKKGSNLPLTFVANSWY